MPGAGPFAGMKQMKILFFPLLCVALFRCAWGWKPSLMSVSDSRGPTAEPGAAGVWDYGLSRTVISTLFNGSIILPLDFITACFHRG